MGKRYYCDYCDKTMVASNSIIRTHVKGVVHQKLVSEHYQRYKDPETILNEELTKKPCSRYPRGDCHFGGICRYSHYTQEQINGLKEYVATKQSKQSQVSCPSFQDLYKRLQDEKSTKPNSVDDQTTVIYDNCGVTHALPWSYNPLYDSYGDGLPPSLKRFKINDLANACSMEWGYKYID